MNCRSKKPFGGRVGMGNDFKPKLLSQGTARPYTKIECFMLCDGVQYSSPQNVSLWHEGYFQTILFEDNKSPTDPRRPFWFPPPHSCVKELR